jgi:hypothetical protein
MARKRAMALVMVVVAAPTLAWAAAHPSVRLTHNTYNDTLLGVDDVHTLWYGAESGLGYTLMWLHDGVTTHQFTDNNTRYQGQGSIRDGRVVWYGSNINNYGIYIADVSEAGAVSAANRVYDTPYIPNNLIQTPNYLYWRMWDGSDYEIYSHHIASGTTTQLTDNSYEDSTPMSDGDRVFYLSKPGAAGSPYELRTLDMNGPTTPVTCDTLSNSNHSVSGDVAVWQAYQDDNWLLDYELFTWDPTNGRQRITFNDEGDAGPLLDRGHLAWGSSGAIRYRSTPTAPGSEVTNEGSLLDAWKWNLVWSKLDPTPTWNHDRDIFACDVDAGTYYQMTDSPGIKDANGMIFERHMAWETQNGDNTSGTPNQTTEIYSTIVATMTVPEPATVGLMAMGTLLLARRFRR